MRRSFVMTSVIMALAASAAAANPFTPTIAIDAAVARFLGAAVGAPGGASRAVDPRLKLAACPDRLEIGWFGHGGTSLQVRCLPRGWRIFVAVSGADGSGSRGETIIARGEIVAMVYEGAGFTLARQGEALEPGARDQWIRIKPLGEQAKPVRAQVVSPGSVRVSAE